MVPFRLLLGDLLKNVLFCSQVDMAERWLDCTWKRHVSEQLKLRDRLQRQAFEELIQQCGCRLSFSNVLVCSRFLRDVRLLTQNGMNVDPSLHLLHTCIGLVIFPGTCDTSGAALALAKS